MGLAGAMVELYLKRYARRLRRTSADAGWYQRRLLSRLVRTARDTWFGREHDFASIESHADFAAAVPIADYAGRQEIFERILHGEPDVCWPGRVRTFARTSGTTGGPKYIPTSKGTRRNQVRAGLTVLACAARSEPGLVRRIFGGEALLIGGRRLLPIETGAVSRGIADVATRRIPWFLRKPFGRKCFSGSERFEDRAAETARYYSARDLRFIGHLPTWTLVVFERVCEAAGVPREGGLGRLWPNLELIVHGGMNMAPYRARIESYLGPDCRPRFQQVYPCTEGFLALQSGLSDPAMELLVDNEVFFEFVPHEEWGRPGARRLTVEEVEPDVPYCVALSTSWGLWAYDLGDIVRFTSVRPPKVMFSGRHKHFLNAFGEHLTAEQVSVAVGSACETTGARVVAFTTAPVYPGGEREVGHVQFVVEFSRDPEGGPAAFAGVADATLKRLNVNYEAKRDDDVLLGPAEAIVVPPGTFREWMRERGRLSDQSKVPVCANDRRYADGVLALVAPESVEGAEGLGAQP